MEAMKKPASHGAALATPSIPGRSQAGNNHHKVAKTRSNPGYMRTGDDRNAWDANVAGSDHISAMESKRSVVRAILTVSFFILAAYVKTSRTKSGMFNVKHSPHRYSDQ